MNIERSAVIAAPIVIVAVFILIYFGVRFLNAATLSVQTISPSEGVECVVVSAGDSTSVDCWSSK